MKSFTLGFVGTLCIAAMLGDFIAPIVPMYWGVALTAAIVIGALRARRGATAGADDAGGGALLGSGDFLCDTCKYNHPSTCSVPDRPNATRCDEYKRKGT